VNKLGKATATAMMMAVLSPALPATAVAAESGADEVQDLQRDVKSLRVQVQALERAFVEMAELDRRQSGSLSTMLDERTAEREPAAPPPAPVPARSEPVVAVRETPAAPVASAAPAEKEKKGASRRRRNRQSGRSRWKAVRQ
jgi:hypothetical protein